MPKTVTLSPSGDSTGSADTTAIAGAAASASYIRLSPGSWHIKAPQIAQPGIWLQGSGPATVLNVLAGQGGLTVSGTSDLCLSDMAFSLAPSSRGATVSGAGNSFFSRLWFTGPAAAGGVAVNGDAGAEQTWTDITFSNVGGTAFGYTRTTAADTGGMYLERVRAVSPPAAAAHGFAFTSAAAAPTPAYVYLYNCSADSYSNDAWVFGNVTGVQADNLWGTLGGSANPGACPVHITGGGSIRLDGGYLYQPQPAGKVALVDGGGNAWFGGGIILDGAGSGGYALGLTAASAAWVADVFSYAAELTDAPWVMATGTAARTPATFITQGNAGAGQAIGVDDAAAPGSQVWIRNSGGTLQFLDAAFGTVIMTLDQSGNLTVAGSITIGLPPSAKGILNAQLQPGLAAARRSALRQAARLVRRPR